MAKKQGTGVCAHDSNRGVEREWGGGGLCYTGLH